MTGAACFTIGVFQDVEWAQRGVAALLRGGFAPESLTIIARDSPAAAELIEATLGGAGGSRRVERTRPGRRTRPARRHTAGEDGALARLGLGSTIARAGFQRHDGHIFETLAVRGGVLVAVRDERRAADALATLHAYGGGNAAIGAYAGRV
jgi:hypothetical protein